MEANERVCPAIRLYSGHLRNLYHLCQMLSITPTSERRETELEILKEGYRHWGYNLVDHLYGSFSFALWDESESELFCARDPFGQESFYYCSTPDEEPLIGIAIHDIVSSHRYEKAIDPEALQLYMMFGYPVGERTLYRDVKKLLPGCTLALDGSSCHIERYFTPRFHPEHELLEEEWATRIDQTLQSIIEEERTSPDFSKASIFLSSGLDSAYLLASTGSKKACSVDYAEQEFSEWEGASRTAAHLGLELDKIHITEEDYFGAIPRFLKSAELPSADPSSIAFFIGCEHAAAHDGPWISGEGADEFFAGYPIYKLADKLAWNDGPQYLGCFGILEQEPACRLLRQKTAVSKEALVQDLYKQTDGDEHLSRILLVDIALWLEGDILFTAGHSARANGIELLLPFADRRMFELSSTIPSNLKLHDGCSKYILRRAAEKRLPHEIAFRKKIGFSTPLKRWLCEDKVRGQLEQTLFNEDSALFFDRELLEGYWNCMLDGDVSSGMVIHAAYVFLVWYRTCFIPEEG